MHYENIDSFHVYFYDRFINRDWLSRVNFSIYYLPTLQNIFSCT